MIGDRLKALQDKVGIGFSEWSKVSEVSEPTIRKIISKETPDPRVETVIKLVYSIGGSMDDVFGVQKEKEIENNAVIVLKEAYESRIAAQADRIEALHERIDDIKKYAESLHRDKKLLGIAVVVLVAIIAGILIYDIAVGTHGWIQY